MDFRNFLTESISGVGWRFSPWLHTKGGGATEGLGIYIGTSKETIDFYGGGGAKGWKLKFTLNNPLINNDETPYGFDLSEMLEELEGQPISPSDSEWVKVHKEVLAIAKKNKLFRGQSPTTQDQIKFNEILTAVIKRHGYDGVQAKWGPYEWVVVFNPKAVSVEK